MRDIPLNKIQKIRVYGFSGDNQSCRSLAYNHPKIVNAFPPYG